MKKMTVTNSQVEKMSKEKLAMFALVALFCVGELYWLALAVEANSKLLFWFAVIPLTAPFTGIIGAWSLIFEVPQWLYPYFV